MKAQHFARNILAAAVLSALGAHAAVAADFSEGVYENHGEQDVYDNFLKVVESPHETLLGVGLSN